jgi:hypothetical protein
LLPIHDHGCLDFAAQQLAPGAPCGYHADLAGKTSWRERSCSKALVQDNRKLQGENARLHKQLSKAEIIIDFQNKAAGLFETTTEIEES